MSLHHIIREQIILPLSDLVNHQQVCRQLRKVREAELWDKEKMHSFQEQQLRKLLVYVSKEVPFYRDWFSSTGFQPEKVSIKQLPIVNKTLMRKEGIDRFAAQNFPIGERITSRTSGSTGEPFTYYESKLSYSVNMAAKLHTWFQAGYRLGDPYMKIANGERIGKWKRVQDKMNRCHFVSFSYVDEEMLKTVLDTIEREKPGFIRSYPGPLYLLAQYRLSHPEYSFSPRRIFTTGSTLYETYRETIERAFGCDVIDSYSCEGTPNVYETPAHFGYRITDYYGIIEVLDEHDQPVTDGIGRVVSTDLWNYAHPFLRYDTQDLVEVRNGQIINVIGRDSNIIHCNNGMMFTVHNFSHFFLYEMNSVDSYQIIKHHNNSITIRLVVNAHFNSNDEKQVVAYWQPRLEMPVNVEIVDDIPLMSNNKRITIVDETID